LPHTQLSIDIGKEFVNQPSSFTPAVLSKKIPGKKQPGILN